MRTLGVDLATEGGITGICEIEWPKRGNPRITYLDKGKASKSGLSDDDLVSRMRAVIGSLNGWVAIDAPFGFPRAFSEAVTSWAVCGSVDDAGGSAPAGFDAETERLWNPINRRITDAHVASRLSALRDGHEEAEGGWQSWPLSSVVERITPTTIRCARLLSRLGPLPVDRIHGRVVETYPIAALRVWLNRDRDGWSSLWKSKMADGTSLASYKDSPEARGVLASRLLAAIKIDRGDVDDTVEKLRTSSDCLDAFVCALVARHVSRNGDGSLPAALSRHPGTIEAEGWIYLPPEGVSLSALLDQNEGNHVTRTD